MNIKHTVLALSCLVSLSGCDMEDEALEEVIVPGASYRGFELGCTDCANSPYVNTFDFPELRLNGQPNEQNVRILGISPSWAPQSTYPLVVKNNILYAFYNQTFVPATDNWIIRLRSVAGDVVADFDLTIEDVEYEETWNDEPTISYNYKIDYEMNNDPWNQCTSGWVTLIQDARFVHDTISVRPDWMSNGWVTLACVGDAAYKTKMLGYTPATSTRLQRKATLKMLTADYCGDGTPYTLEDTEVHWYDDMYNENDYQELTPLNVEAHWGASGATCLNHERVAEFQDDIHCSIPACGDRNGNGLTTFQQGELWISEIRGSLLTF